MACRHHDEFGGVSGIGSAKGMGIPCDAGINLAVSGVRMVNSNTVPCGTPSCTEVSGAGLCVGPMIKFLPSIFARSIGAVG